jgi:acetyl-CoA decarbonylase/synthase complex subunit gamma
MQYTVDPGLYALGNPDDAAPVIVTANYCLTLSHLRKELAGRSAWILVLDTKGINVWCAAGKGTFGTNELVNRIEAVHLCEVVKHRTLILPQLGAPGVAAHEVKKATGFSVNYGPILARDLPAYLDNGQKATTPMRTVTFPVWDRLILTPMEIIPALKKFFWVILGCWIIMGVQPAGILFKPALLHSWPIIAAGLLAMICGTIITPVLLPIIPFRSFAAKGAIIGIVIIVPSILLVDRYFSSSISLVAATALFFVAVSSYLALNFTGCTPFTGISGVKKEMKVAVPAYLIACSISGLLLIFYKLHEWSIL